MGNESKYFDASDEAKAFVRENLMVDSLTSAADTGWPKEEMFEEYHARAAETGIDVTGITLTGASQTTSDLIAQVIRNFQHVYSGDKMQVVRSAADIESARQNGKLVSG